MLVNDIVVVKDLDYSRIDEPTEAEAKKQQRELIKELTSLSGKAFKVISTNVVGDQNYVVIESPDKKKIVIGENEHPITVLESEVDVVETDYLNNCCLNSLNGGSIRDDFICQTCGFCISTLINQHNKNNENK